MLPLAGAHLSGAREEPRIPSHGEASFRRIVSEARRAGGGAAESRHRLRTQGEEEGLLRSSRAAAAAASGAPGESDDRGPDGGGHRRPRLRSVLPPAEASNLPGEPYTRPSIRRVGPGLIDSMHSGMDRTDP